VRGSKPGTEKRFYAWQGITGLDQLKAAKFEICRDSLRKKRGKRDEPAAHS
jgi:hypothetical protein